MALRIENIKLPTERNLTFFLEEEDGKIQLRAMAEGDTKGNAWYIATISPEGILLEGGISGDQGIAVDAEGRVVLLDERQE